MKTSVVIAHVPYSKEADTMLDTCITSLKGKYNELIIVVNDGIGYGQAFNRGAKYAKGDFIFLISNDTKLVEGSLYDMLYEQTVTTPLVNNTQTQFGCFCCIPRLIYESVGLFDEQFKGAYWEDEDLLRRWQKANISLIRIDEVRVDHIGGATVKAIMNEDALFKENKKLFDIKYG